MKGASIHGETSLLPLKLRAGQNCTLHFDLRSCFASLWEKSGEDVNGFIRSFWVFSAIFQAKRFVLLSLDEKLSDWSESEIRFEKYELFIRLHLFSLLVL